MHCIKLSRLYIYINEPRDSIFDRPGFLIGTGSTAEEHEMPATKSRLISVMCVRAMPLAWYLSVRNDTAPAPAPPRSKHSEIPRGGERLNRIAKVVCTCSLGVNPCMPCNSAGASRIKVASGLNNLSLLVFFII